MLSVDSLREQSTFFIGVNIGVRRSQVGAALVDGQMLGEESFDTPSDSDIALSQVRASIERLRVSLPDRTISAIGVSVPGPTDAERTRLLFAPHLGWRDVAVASALRITDSARARTLNHEVRVLVENDATAAAMYSAAGACIITRRASSAISFWFAPEQASASV